MCCQLVWKCPGVWEPGATSRLLPAEPIHNTMFCSWVPNVLPSKVSLILGEDRGSEGPVQQGLECWQLLHSRVEDTYLWHIDNILSTSSSEFILVWVHFGQHQKSWQCAVEGPGKVERTYVVQSRTDVDKGLSKTVLGAEDLFAECPFLDTSRWASFKRGLGQGKVL